jgi:hypothetical protein
MTSAKQPLNPRVKDGFTPTPEVLGNYMAQPLIPCLGLSNNAIGSSVVMSPGDSFLRV